MWDVEFVEVYAGSELVALHRRSLVPYGYSTEDAHMPESHKAYERSKEVNAASLIDWGARIGPSVKWAIEDILRRTTFPQQAYGRCNGLLSLARKYGSQRLDRACAMQREQSGTASYQSLRNMLKNNMDLDADPRGIVSRTPHNDNVRGAAAYRRVTMKGKEDGYGK